MHLVETNYELKACFPSSQFGPVTANNWGGEA